MLEAIVEAVVSPIVTFARLELLRMQDRDAYVKLAVSSGRFKHVEDIGEFSVYEEQNKFHIVMRGEERVFGDRHYNGRDLEIKEVAGEHILITQDYESEGWHKPVAYAEDGHLFGRSTFTDVKGTYSIDGKPAVHMQDCGREYIYSKEGMLFGGNFNAIDGIYEVENRSVLFAHTHSDGWHFRDSQGNKVEIFGGSHYSKKPKISMQNGELILETELEITTKEKICYKKDGSTLTPIEARG